MNDLQALLDEATARAAETEARLADLQTGVSELAGVGPGLGSNWQVVQRSLRALVERSRSDG